jgi:subtilase family serine protease
VTAAVLHLSDFRPKANLRPHPEYTTRSSQTHFLSPWDVQTMYDLGGLLNGYYDGVGQAIAIVGQSFAQTGYGSPVYTFRTNFSGTVTSITPVIVPGSGVEAIIPGDAGESEIDIEYSNGIAGGANIFYVYSGSNMNYDVNDAINFAIASDIAPVISVSYSQCEPLLSAADAQQANAVFQQAAAQGQTIVVASGDSGATACAEYSLSSGVTTAQQQELAADFPASSPYVTAVGGTQMAPGTFAAGSSPYWKPSVNGDALGSLIAYTPEVVWNEDSPNGLLASGGGSSTLFPRPAWQAGVPGIPSGAFRLVPDLALQASTESPGYLICSDDPAIVGSNVDCDNSLQSTGDTYVVDGGTSFAAPIFAGFVAILNQYEQTAGLGNINPVLYGLAGQPSLSSSIFHDITSGTTACVSGNLDCGTAGQNNYAATVGYDLATGLGSVDFAKLVAAWPSNSGPALTPTYITFTDNETLYAGTSASPGASVSITVGVNANIQPGTYTAPTGTLSVTLDGESISPPGAIAPPPSTSGFASTTYTLTAPSAAGSHVLLFHYSGDSTHQASTGTFALMVGSAVPSGTIALSATNVSVSADSTGSSHLTITPSGGYNGFLTWTSSYTGGTAAQSICYFVDAPPVNGPTTGTVQLGLGTACTTPGALKVPSTVERSDARVPLSPRFRAVPAAAGVLALLLFGILPSSRRRLPPLLALATLAVLPLTLSGCGGSSNSGGGGGTTGPQAQVYTLTFTAKDSVNTAITASTSFTLTVN